jgi:hypothetical protein
MGCGYRGTHRGPSKKARVHFKRQDVRECDEKLMKEVQRLPAQGFQLIDSEDFSQIYAEWQAARDCLGPLEDDYMGAESRLDEQEWELIRAEVHLHTKFESEFRHAKDTFSHERLDIALDSIDDSPDLAEANGLELDGKSTTSAWAYWAEAHD